MNFSTLKQTVDRPFFYVIPTILVITIALFTKFGKKTTELGVPFYGNEEGNPEAPKKRWMKDALNLLREGYSKYPDRIFQIWTTEGNQFVLPPKYIDELKRKPDNIMPSSLPEFFQGRHTTFTAPDRPPRIQNMIKNVFNKNMPKIFSEVKNEFDYSFPREFPQKLKEWTPIMVYPKVCRLVFLVSGRAFSGQSLYHNDDWMMLNINYTRDAFSAALQIRKYPEWLRPFAKYFIPEVRNLWAHNKKATAFLAPLIKERNKAEKKPGYEKPNDALEWIRESLPEWEKKDYEYQAIQQLALGAASIQTSSQLTTHVIFDLAAHPEYIPELREEIQTVLEKHNGEWGIESMHALKKMDSFIKESQRNSPTLISFQRKALQPITLSDGTFIPKGTYLLAASEAVSHDPKFYENPDEFDGLRFYKMRQTLEEENKYQLISTGNTQLHFGGGRHACPGRWFASYEIKLIISALIMEYDMKTIEGVGRPKNILYQSMFNADPTAEILFKSRT